jgi:hypothetical protein
MALSQKRVPKSALKELDTADIVREAMLRQPSDYALVYGQLAVTVLPLRFQIGRLGCVR